MPEEAIIEDYTLSHEWGCSVEGKWHVRQNLPERVRGLVDQEVLDQWCEAPEEVLREIFDGLREEHGSVEAYLDAVGIDAELRARLTDTLTIEAAEVVDGAL